MFLPLLTLVLSALLAAPAFATPDDNNANAYLALTTNGPIIGHPAANAPSVAEYLGIPYAQPPIGPLRFAAPQPYVPGTDNPNNNGTAPFIAARYGATCPQTASARVAYPDRTPQAQRVVANFAGQLNHTQSEDCLTLNVWTSVASTSTAGAPSSQRSSQRSSQDSERKKLKPILVFIHGGRFTIGESHTPFFDGAKLAASQDVVVVTLNYRVSIFGFPGDAAGLKNLAFRDQRLAVEWVRDNAAAFGGDAGRIVVAGQSAGGAAVDYWAYAYREEPVVAGIVPMSGNVWSFPVHSAEVAGERWANVSAAAGCVEAGVEGEGGVLECMRGKDFEVIKKAVAGLKLPTVSGQGRSEAVFQPTVDNETVFDQETLKKMTEAGEFARVVRLNFLSSNVVLAMGNETNYWQPYLVGNTHFEAGYYRWAAYGAGSILTDAQWDNFNLVTFTCPSTYGAAARARFGVPSWIYRYGGDWDNVRLYPNSSAYHGSDMHALFGNSEEVSGLPEEDAQRGLTRVIMQAWVAFARDPWDGLHELGWGEYANGKLAF